MELLEAKVLRKGRRCGLSRRERKARHQEAREHKAQGAHGVGAEKDPVLKVGLRVAVSGGRSLHRAKTAKTPRSVCGWQVVGHSARLSRASIGRRCRRTPYIHTVRIRRGPTPALLLWLVVEAWLTSNHAHAEFRHPSCGE